MALKSEFGDESYDAWEDWSRNDRSFNRADAQAIWKSVDRDGGITLGTLFHEAGKYGWHGDGHYPKPSPEELAKRKRDAEERVEKEKADVSQERAITAQKAAAIWRAATEARTDNPYLERKGASPVQTLREIDSGEAAAILGYAPKSGGEPLTGRLLAIPIKQGNSLSTLELIDGEGRKTALVGHGTKAGAGSGRPSACPMVTEMA